MEVEVIFADSRIFHERGSGPAGEKLFTIEDAYHHADFVTYPSTYEGFGNAFLEAVYYRKPILCNRYAIYRTDIEPCGFDVILMDGFLTDDVVDQVREILRNRQRRRQMVEHNYEMGRRFFSYRRIADELLPILSKPRRSAPPESVSGSVTTG
jgi:glycosyltransferase involved in cell wall biosynthesis